MLIGILRKQIKPGFRGEGDCFDYTIEKGCQADKLFPVRELYYSKPSSKFTIRRSWKTDKYTVDFNLSDIWPLVTWKWMFLARKPNDDIV